MRTKKVHDGATDASHTAGLCPAPLRVGAQDLRMCFSELSRVFLKDASVFHFSNVCKSCRIRVLPPGRIFVGSWSSFDVIVAVVA